MITKYRVCPLSSSSENSDIPSNDPLTAASLQTYLNSITYNQCVVQFTVGNKGPKEINYDLNRDRMLDVTTWTTTEMDAIINMAKESGFDYNIFIVNNMTIPVGYMSFNQQYGFVCPSGGIQTTTNTVAHELGHGFGGMPHSPISDIQNLMHAAETNPWRLRKNQWDKCNP